jgi:hypothetical protein
MDRDQKPHLNGRSTPASQSSDERALVASGLWLLLGFIGATALAAGMLQLFEGHASWLSSLVLVVGGGILGAASWSRGQAVLEHTVRAPAIGKDASADAIRELPRRTSQSRIRSAAGVARPAGMSRERKLGRS